MCSVSCDVKSRVWMDECMRKGFLCNIQSGIPQHLIDHREEGCNKKNCISLIKARVKFQQLFSK